LSRKFAERVAIPRLSVRHPTIGSSIGSSKRRDQDTTQLRNAEINWRAIGVFRWANTNARLFRNPAYFDFRSGLF
jgi:hypothetical protein